MGRSPRRRLSALCRPSLPAGRPLPAGPCAHLGESCICTGFPGVLERKQQEALRRVAGAPSPTPSPPGSQEPPHAARARAEGGPRRAPLPGPHSAGPVQTDLGPRPAPSRCPTCGGPAPAQTLTPHPVGLVAQVSSPLSQPEPSSRHTPRRSPHGQGPWAWRCSLVSPVLPITWVLA